MKKYVLKGFDRAYTNFAEAQNEANRMKMREIPLGFESEEEAEAFRLGQWMEYFEKTFQPFETDADAVVYADGSWDKDEKYGAYGVVIFFKDGEIFCESATLRDVEPGRYEITRFDARGEQDGETVYRSYVDVYKGMNVEEKKHNFVSASHQDGGECESVMRALEICCKEKNLKKIVLVYDCEFVKLRYEKGSKDATANVPKAYGDFAEDLRKNYGVKIEFIKVDSHTDKKGKGQYLVGDAKYPHAVYNDIVDILAKAETVKNPIGRSENFNVTRVIPEEFKTFHEISKRGIPARRAHARSIYEAVVTSEILRPVFKA